MRESNARVVFIVLYMITLLAACSSDDDGSPTTIDPGGVNKPSVSITVSIAGSVVLSDDAQTPLMGVDVSIEGKNTQTDENGSFVLTNISAMENSDLLVSFSKAGFTNNQRYVIIGDKTLSNNYAITATLSAYQSSTIVDPKLATGIDVANPANTSAAPLATINFPAGSIATNSNVEVNIVVGDPSTKKGQAIFPGDYRAINSGEITAATQLESVAFLDITVMDQGKKITTLNKPAQVKVKLPEIYQINGSMYGTYDPNDSAKQFIEWWSYDDKKGNWMREDADTTTTKLDNARVIADNNGVLYAQAMITHFSWWNADKPITQHACVCVIVVDETGNPIVGARVFAQGSTYNGASTQALTDKSGKACVNVKRSIDTTLPEKFRLIVNNGGISFTYDVTDPVEGDVNTDEIFAPTTQGSTLDNSGQCSDLNNTLLVSYGGTITGQVTIEGGAVVANQTIYTNYGLSAMTNDSGVYTIKAPIGTVINLSLIGALSQRISVPDATPLNVDFVLPNQAPLINSLIRNPEGIVLESSLVTLTVNASDPEGKRITYTWSTSTGSLSATTGNSVQWSAPAGQGTASIFVTASDGVKETKTSVTILYDPVIVGNGNLKFTFLTNEVDNTPAAGVVVALYNRDNITIKTTMTSGLDGIVDFGQVSARATVTIVSEFAAPFSSQKNIDTIVDFIPVTTTYYLDENTQLYQNNCNKTFGDINITGFFKNTATANLAPLVAGGSVDASGTSNILDARYCANDALQTDNMISLLATGKDSQNNPTSYGYLLDQVPGNTITPYTITADMPYATYSYASPAGRTFDSIRIQAIRKGVTVPISSNIPSIVSFPPSGTIQVASGFPADMYAFTSSDSIDSAKEEWQTVYWQSINLPTNLVPRFADVQITTSTYDTTNKTVSWVYTGTGVTDVVDLSLHKNINVTASGTFEASIWDVTLPPGNGVFILPELPAPANTWVDVVNLDSTDICINVTASDMDLVTGFDEFLYFLTTDTDFSTMTLTYTSSSKIAQGTCVKPVVPQQFKSLSNTRIGSEVHSIIKIINKFNRY